MPLPSPSSPPGPATERKIIALTAISAILGVLVIAGLIISRKNTEIEQLEQWLEATKVSLPTPIPGISPIIPFYGWGLVLSEEESKADIGLKGGDLLYAAKNAEHVSLYQRNLETGSQIKLFGYDESVPADTSGNLWSGLPPSIALSPNKSSVAITDVEGLKIYDLQKKTQGVLIRKTSEPGADDVKGATWSIPAITGTYRLAHPQWSADGRYISFAQSHYEGSSVGMIDVHTRRYALVEGGRSVETQWSPTNVQFLSPGWVTFIGPGLFISLGKNPEETTNIATVFGKANAGFNDVAFSPDGKRLVFTFVESEATEDQPSLGVADVDGKNFQVIHSFTTEGSLKPFFSADNNSIFYFHAPATRLILYQYNLATQETTEIASLPTDYTWESKGWTGEGYLSLLGVGHIKDDKARYIVLDLADKDPTTIYVSPILSRFTTILGYTTP